MVNKVILIGRLGRDPEVRRLENGTAVAKFSVATTEAYKDKAGEWQNQTEWHDIVLWRQLAERAERDLKKGMLVFVEGKLTHRKYQDKEGNDRYITEIVGDTFRMMEKRESGGYLPNEEAQGGYQGTTPAAPSVEADDDLPF
ncbi:MAG: single-stranded DNA-binding protein [Saprospiraceae bacterium]|nr:single-stranded DNA-binding protein [Saprospiraceae bacterium]MBP7679917.1 single-stranded DNA-binding protein [Saprospiraceae bacterium]